MWNVSKGVAQSTQVVAGDTQSPGFTHTFPSDRKGTGLDALLKEPVNPKPLLKQSNLSYIIVKVVSMPLYQCHHIVTPRLYFKLELKRWVHWHFKRDSWHCEVTTPAVCHSRRARKEATLGKPYPIYAWMPCIIISKDTCVRDFDTHTHTHTHRHTQTHYNF